MNRKNAEIIIKSTQHDIDNTTTEQTYSGHYAYQNGIHLLSYEETFEADTESAVVKNLYKITSRTLYLSKSGAISTKMLFDIEKSYQNIYRTPLGCFDILLRTKSLEILATEENLKILLNYDLFMNHNFISNCSIDIFCRII